jgi:hypothetical protein
MKWTIDKSHLPSFVRVETDGKPVLNDLMDLWQELIESDFWQPDFTVLIDNRSLGPISEPDKFTMGAIEFFAANKDQVGKACIATISAEPNNFKYARQFQYGIRLKGSDAVLQIFGTETQALDWLEHYCKMKNEKGWAVAAPDN